MTATINPYDKAHELARSLTNSDLFLNYVAAKNELEKEPELKEKILDLRRRQMELNRAQILGEEVAEGSISEITLEFAKMNQKKELADFFNAEGQFLQMFNDIQEILQKAIASGLEK